MLKQEKEKKSKEKNKEKDKLHSKDWQTNK